MNKHFKKISNYAMIGGFSALALVALSGCNNTSSNQDTQNTVQSLQQSKKGAFVILEEQSDGKYKVAEEYPSDHTRVIVRDQNGNERILTQEEIDKLIKEEEAKINNGTSELTSSGSSLGMGLGGALLASAAGAILGSYIGNKLFNNPNFQQNQMRNYKSPQAYERSQNSFNSARSSNAPSNTRGTNSGKSGFFGSSSSNSSSYGG
ncbi:UPF0323 family lipoprotein [Helicobacter kayseriensis]|uniref:UPF0323 family lipoprotein n=1 Tax=Helicobacter kayseriensis TaxID=2905877 RepID=UPI001E3FA159|nr:UPF0323 family lipoprotein [Helicobacter kayseriensis]MCE3046641.1 UPF0323 family lipoprotein [Helicobacter kayseriensis]MCE3048057.1 UPF0323 family lipoprotein [Helicobacter kayseriensis]